MPSLTDSISTPVTEPLREVCAWLRRVANQLRTPTDWPAEQLRRCGASGLFRGLIPESLGGSGWSNSDLTAAYVQLAASCLTTAFVISQRSAAVRRIVVAPRESMCHQALPGLSSGELFATVAISHLSTSRRHLGVPAMQGQLATDCVRLEGSSAWVTGAKHADWLVVGAETADGRQLMLAVPRDAAGLECEPPADLVALSASCTGGIRCRDVTVPSDFLIAGPQVDLMAAAAGGSTGGLPTSALALGLAAAALDYLTEQAARRGNLAGPLDALTLEWNSRARQLMDLARGSSADSQNDLRAGANSLVLRATQAALAAAKGAGYVADHPVGRWCREALFFLVWSCPPAVVDSNLCELAARWE